MTPADSFGVISEYDEDGDVLLLMPSLPDSRFESLCKVWVGRDDFPKFVAQASSAGNTS